MLLPCNPTPTAVLDRVGTELRTLEQRLWAGVCDEDLVEGVHALEVLGARAAAVRARMLAEVDQREIARKQLSWTSTHEWFAHLAGVTVGQARRTVGHARSLVGDRSTTLQALVSGAISQDQADIVCSAVDDLPPSRELRDEAERLLLDEAGRLNGTDLRKASRHLIEVVDPDRTERQGEADLRREERAAHVDRFFTVVEDGAGGVRVKGRGSLEDGAVLRAALIPLTKPDPTAVESDVVATAHHDPRGHGARMWDALVQVAQHSLDSDLPPATHGARARVGVFIDLESLRTGAGAGRAAVTETGERLPVAAVRRLACDADVIPICLGSQSQVLDVGRTRRLVTMALWLALIARDRHCTFPGCSRPPVMCHGHHVRHWVEGGATALDNLVMLCGAHHRVIHHSPWEVRLSPIDARPEFRPPPSRGSDLPPPEWIRHRPRPTSSAPTPTG